MPNSRALALVALFVPSLLACATTPPVVTSKLHGQRIVVAPLNLAVHSPEELLGQQEPVWRELIGFLETHNEGVGVLNSGTAGVIWEDTLADMVKSDTPPELGAALASFARRLADQTPYDVLVVPSLVLRRARVLGEQARWDGVERRLPLLKPAEYESVDVGSFSVQKRGFRGSISAASLHVMMFEPGGAAVFDGLGGLSVIQEADRKRAGSPWSLALRANPFDVPDDLREGIARAFEEQRASRTAVAW